MPTGGFAPSFAQACSRAIAFAAVTRVDSARTTPSASTAIPAITHGAATTANAVDNGTPIASIAPPAIDPTTEPPRPIPFAQLTPVVRHSVG
ncbi:hypothetical protein WR31_35670 [Burkholderia contaminans LMG 23361]|uniref:Uncharacterized protein n=1 Tax=Burkholderia contaminans LMG 23361 TaxID=1334628 RepID=A0ABD4AMG3_9BURK|nr:hypothetical protein WR31_35670 [Burkholderia contaminans LMG 23361]